MSFQTVAPSLPCRLFYASVVRHWLRFAAVADLCMLTSSLTKLSSANAVRACSFIAERRQVYAKLPSASAIRACSFIAERRQVYAKLPSAGAIRACSFIAERNQVYAKLPSASAVRACSFIAERNQVYAKLSAIAVKVSFCRITLFQFNNFNIAFKCS